MSNRLHLPQCFFCKLFSTGLEQCDELDHWKKYIIKNITKSLQIVLGAAHIFIYYYYFFYSQIKVFFLKTLWTSLNFKPCNVVITTLRLLVVDKAFFE